MAYWEWGDPANDQVLVCVHGLTRTGRDFDALAQRLAGRYRVVCPDVVGRGRSDWLANPAFYTVPQYAADMVTLIARLKPARLAWVGTSMGGLIGMALSGSAAFSRAAAAMRPHPKHAAGAGRAAFRPHGAERRRPRLELSALARIGQYVGMPREFDSFEQAVAAMRADSLPFGPHSDEQWAQLARYVYPEQDGRWVKHYDLALAQPLAAQTPQELAAGSSCCGNAMWARIARC